MRAQISGRFPAFADFELEAYLCAELAPERHDALEHARRADPGLDAYLQERTRARAEFAAMHPLRLPPASAASADGAARRGPARSRARRRWLLSAGIAAPALACALALWLGLLPDPRARSRAGGEDGGRAETPLEPDAIRVKGNALAAELYVKRGERVFRPRPGELLKAGDRVRLTVDAARAGYLTVLARDETGAVSTYYDRLALQPGRFTVPDSLQLDGSTSDELWLVLIASEPRPAEHYARAFAAGQAVDASHVLLPVHKEKP